MHDRIAELAGLRQELDICENGPRRDVRGETADQVREQINRVRDELGAEADKFEKQAEEMAGNGQDVAAARAAVAARDLREALDADDDSVPAAKASKGRKPQGTAGKQNAAASKPAEKA